MTNLSQGANMDWNEDKVCANTAVGGSGIVPWLTTVIHRIWDAINVNGGQLPGEDGDYYHTGGCCCV